MHLARRAVRLRKRARPAGRRRGRRGGIRGLARVARRMVELEPERRDVRSVVEERVTGLADEVRRDAPAREEGLEVDGGTVDGRIAPAGPLDLRDLQPTPLCRLGDRLDLEDVRVERGRAVSRTAGRSGGTCCSSSRGLPARHRSRGCTSLLRCSGGAWVRRPLPFADVPFLRNSDIVGMRPCFAYRSTMSWRIPSAAKNTALSIDAFGLSFVAFTAAELAAPAASPASAVAAMTATSVMRLILWYSPLSRLESPTAVERRVRAVPSRAAPRMLVGQPRAAGTRAAASSRSSNLRLPLSQTAPAFGARASLVRRSAEWKPADGPAGADWETA